MVVLEGRVVSKNINAGSKSEHVAAVLVTDGGELKLRLKGGQPFADPEVQSLVGRRIRAEGFLSAGQFIMTRYEIISP